MVRPDNRMARIFLPLSLGFLSSLGTAAFSVNKHIKYLTEELPQSPFTDDIRKVLLYVLTNELFTSHIPFITYFPFINIFLLGGRGKSNQNETLKKKKKIFN